MKSSIIIRNEDRRSTLTSYPRYRTLWNLTKPGECAKLNVVKNLFRPHSLRKDEKIATRTAPSKKPLSSLIDTETTPISQRKRTSKSSSVLTITSNATTQSRDKLILPEDPDCRSIILSGFSKGTSASSILSLVRGGPLEKVTFVNGEAELLGQGFHSKDKSGTFPTYIRYPAVVLSFLYPADALRFMEYATGSSLLRFHNKPLSAQWAYKWYIKSLRESPLALHIIDEVLANKASRFVILSRSSRKTITDVPQGHKHPSAYGCFSVTFNCNELKFNFSQFGQIVEVTPILDRKLAVCIQFADIRSAILVMHTFKSKNSVLSVKYSLWNIQYLRDAADLPCYCP